MQENAVRELQIPKQLDELQYTIETLAKALDSLLMRLSKITTPEMVNPSDSKIPVPVLCEYADNIANKTAQLRRLRDMVMSLDSRLEL